MNAKTSLAALGLILAATAAPHGASAADAYLGTAQMFDGVSGGRAVCYFTNIGTTTVTLRSISIFSNGSPVALAINECGATIALTAGRSCGIAANTGDDIPYGCAAITTDKTITRGNFELRGPNPPQEIRRATALQ